MPKRKQKRVSKNDKTRKDNKRNSTGVSKNRSKNRNVSSNIKAKKKLTKEEKAYLEYIEDLEDEGLTEKQIQKEIEKIRVPAQDITPVRRVSSKKKYADFLLTFTVHKHYDYNRPDELEIFNRTIPLVNPMTLKGFQEKELQYFINEERRVFDKIEQDTGGAVSWRNWTVECRGLVSEEEVDTDFIHIKLKNKRRLIESEEE